MDKLQKEFEAWLESEFGMWAIQARPGVYGSEQIQDMWKAWQAALSANGGEAVAFGSGDYTIEVGGYVDNHAVFIAPANPTGKMGDLAPPTTGEDKHRLVPGERVMTFPTEAQAFAVAEAIAGRRVNRLDGSHPAPPSVAVPEGTESALSFIKQALALPSKPLPDPHAHSHEAYARALHEAFCAIRFKLMHAMDALAAAPSPDHIADAGKVVSGNEVKARVVSGARDMLRESSKQFRAIGDIGHAAMCENHADELDRLRTTDDKAEGV
ncbi:hypothetical protein [Alcanivorax jadensis]|uniref:hypothetical protein n=1 Tax=Alcanivorax jadensis TaxID=64988 RepID=UPI002357BDE4|nr:hypothetical protein [Alcanivorax jadensis]|tara:strand:+ start:27753 stop:28556 length:804 start_codon:yes stop_codon:yes gene_type:complete